ncbi:MAG: hypothetical protein HN712_27085 [Gemmatimonadetes bacterium]|nr:hypothetical protein [Gemmatimonadota bacterium]MBT6147574.1 hypothetical protein [Gemmatimonadota bacterium]MBT7864006.1 hypothetical protein [Gemmatimonadota bacterium]
MERNKIAFFRGRKIGGTSIEEAMHGSIGSHCRISMANVEDDFSGFDLVTYIGPPCADIIRAVDGRTTFAVVRNPYDKARSAYWYLRDTIVPPGAPFRDHSLEYCLQNLPACDDDSQGHGQGHHYKHFTMTQTQYLYLDGKLVADHLLRFEDLGNEVNAFFESQGYDVPEMPHMVRGKYDAELTHRECELIGEIFHDDFINFGYDLRV